MEHSWWQEHSTALHGVDEWLGEVLSANTMRITLYYVYETPLKTYAPLTLTLTLQSNMPSGRHLNRQLADERLGASRELDLEHQNLRVQERHRGRGIHVVDLAKVDVPYEDS